MSPPLNFNAVRLAVLTASLGIGCASTPSARPDEPECTSIPVAERASCPLLGPIVAVEEIQAGVRLFLRDGTDVETLVQRMRCHLAFAKTREREGVDRCPLRLPGVQVVQTGPLAFEMTVRRQSDVQSLQQRLADVLAGYYGLHGAQSEGR